MRPTVEPPTMTRCKHCGGELRLKAIEESSPALDKNVEILVCVGCGCERAVTIGRDQHLPRHVSRT